MTAEAPGSRLGVLYLSGRRGRERELLAPRPLVDLVHVPVQLRAGPGRVLAAWREAARALPSADVVLVESAAAYGLLGLGLARRHRLPLALRFKGDLWAEAAEALRAPRGVAARNAIGAVERAGMLLNYRAGRALLARADLVLPNSERLARLVRQRLPAVAARVRVVPPAVAAPAEVPRPAHPPDHVLTVTRFQFRAKVAPLMAAAPLLAPVLKALGLGWRILGDGPYLGQLEAALGETRAGVTIEGHADALAAYARGPLAVLYFTGLDGLPRALLEAWAHALPVLVNRDGPAAEVVVDGVDGLVVDALDPAGVARALAGLRDRPETARALAARGRQRVLAEFSIESAGARLEAALSDLVRARREGSGSDVSWRDGGAWPGG